MWPAARRCPVSGVAEDLDDPDTRIVAHHIVAQQHLNRIGLGHLLWDVANGLAVSERVHRRHHAGLERIERRFVPERAEEFAARLGLGWYLDKHYGLVVDQGGEDELAI